MSLATLETALVEYVADVLVNDCGRPVPDHVLRYHDELPHYCCTDNGVLAINWTIETMVGTFPNGAQRDPCAGMPQATLNIKYVVCWPALEMIDGAVVMNVEEWDERAAMLADVADCVSRALVALRCGAQHEPVDEYVQAVLDESGRRVLFVDATPMPIRGLCTGVRWRLYAQPLTPPAAS